MDMTVRVDSWQMQCCGEPFRRGSQVAWTLGPAGSDWLKTMLGPHGRQTVDVLAPIMNLPQGSGWPPVISRQAKPGPYNCSGTWDSVSSRCSSGRLSRARADANVRTEAGHASGTLIRTDYR